MKKNSDGQNGRGALGRWLGAAAVLGALSALGAAGGGCARSVQPRVDRSWEGVAAERGPDQRAFAGGQEWSRPEYGRRDGELSIREPRALVSSDQWPEVPRADIGSPRYVFVRTSDRTLLFFVPRRADGRRGW